MDEGRQYGCRLRQPKARLRRSLVRCRTKMMTMGAGSGRTGIEPGKLGGTREDLPIQVTMDKDLKPEAHQTRGNQCEERV